MDSDELYTGPTTLAPGANDYGRKVAARLLVPLSVLFFVVVLLFYVFFKVFAVSGPSMEPTLLDGDRVLVTKGYRNPERGDIVVFRTVDRLKHQEDLIKRVVGIPGDTVEVRQGVAIVNGAVEPSVSILSSPYDGTYNPPTVIERDHVFLMGDNRPIALDSRQLGPIPTSAIEGEAVYLFAPISRARSLP